MVWSGKQNASGKTPQTSFTCQSKLKKKLLEDVKLYGPITLRVWDEIAYDFAHAK